MLMLKKLVFLVWFWYYYVKTETMDRNNQNERVRNENETGQNNEQSNAIKNPDEWTTGGEEITGAQRSYLNTLAQEAGEEVNEDLTKAEASKKIDELQQKTGRGLDH